MNNQCVLSASSIEGDNVQNQAGEDLGTIKDIMICTKSNEVQYYVLSFGGILGMGDKLFAIPPEAMEVNTEKECFVLNISKEKLENAEGFDKDNWPNFADPSFRDNLYSYYGYETNQRRAA